MNFVQFLDLDGYAHAFAVDKVLLVEDIGDNQTRIWFRPNLRITVNGKIDDILTVMRANG